MPISGGSLTGALLLSAAPTDPLSAATKKYVDDNVGSGGIPSSRSITAGTGLTGGGDLSVDRTISIAAVITSETNVGSTSVIPVITYNNQGQLTNVTTATISPSTIGALPTSTSLTAGAGVTLSDSGMLINGITIGLSNSITTGTLIGSSSVVPVISYNAQGMLTAVSTATITSSTIGALPNTTALTAGTGIGLTNGGTLSGGVTVSISNTTVTGAGVSKGSATKVPQITYNAQGQLTVVTEYTITPAWGSITSKPTSISTYGIVDAVNTSRSIIAGSGLSGGGDLSADRTIYITNSITTGTLIGSSSVVPVISYNGQGMLTAVSTATITASTIGALPTTTALSEGTGISISNGGTISGGISISIANTGVSGVGTAAGSSTVVPIISYNQQGQLTVVSTATITPAWSSITGTPTTLALYGITDGVSTTTTLTSNALIIGNGTNSVKIGPVPGSGDDQKYLQWNNSTGQYQFNTPAGSTQVFTSPYVITFTYSSSNIPSAVNITFPSGWNDNGSTTADLKVAHNVGKEPRIIIYRVTNGSFINERVMTSSSTHYLQMPSANLTSQFNIISLSPTNCGGASGSTLNIYIYF